MQLQLSEILSQYRENSSNNRDMGTLFEKLVKHYLINDAKYKNRFSNVWLWDEYPGKTGSDSGIDIVAQEADGGYCAVQCKFYQEDKKIDKSDLDSFFTASGKMEFVSRIIVSTSTHWTKKAEEALEEQQISVTRIDITDLESSNINWDDYYKAGRLSYKAGVKKQLRDHQSKALNAVKEGLKVDDRGKIIMACGTGKTFTSLKIMEDITPKGGRVLFLVPSLALLSQTHKEWSEQADCKLKQFAICSDSKVGKDQEDLRLVDLEIPATTNHKTLINKSKASDDEIVVMYSTYHSLDVIAKAQEEGLSEFDLVICDEAHRTTGIENSHFTKIHDNNYIRAKKRLYMTATPRIYSDAVKSKASIQEIEIASMDDESKYGKQLYYIGFGDAVDKGLLTDYKVLILAVSESYVSASMQQALAEEGSKLEIGDVAKIIGCWNGLSKNIEGEEQGLPMQRAVSFCQTINNSKDIKNHFQKVVTDYKALGKTDKVLSCEIKHVDGKMNAFERKSSLEWLKAEDIAENECRILSNAKCLSEGVDVPSLDAVMFLQPRKSQVEIIQAVGRVMRKSPGKSLGYIILPVVVAAGKTPEEALNSDKAYDVVWQVLQAIRSHDERLDAIINSIALNKNSDNKKISVVGVGFNDDEENDAENTKDQATQINLDLSLGNLIELKEAIFTKMVQKCGDRIYWEKWAQDVAKIAQSNILRISDIIKQNAQAQAAFTSFLSGLQNNINKSIGQEEAIEMLAQHIITKPIFNAMFANYDFASQNIVSKEMQSIVDVLEKSNVDNENKSLEAFYESIKKRVSGIHNAEGKQKIIVELYDNFFREAFPKMAERLGIVYTPVEVVDFIINSVEYSLNNDFNTSLTNKNVNVIDPFTGTGTFITRLLQSGLIKPQDLEYKYKNEIHANEIVLLAYYIASINIETVYHYLAKQNQYMPFEGIVLTDTFNMFESKDLLKNAMPENSQRIARQKNTPVKVILGNPPYSVGQRSENDNNKNFNYPKLDSNIANTYVANSSATLKNSLYDSYIRALRWASDRLNDANNQNGIIAFVTNGSFLDSNATDGLRKSFINEFNKIYCFNLRGDARTSGELRRQEGGGIFGGGSRAPIAITLLIKTQNHDVSTQNPCQVNYYDIGDYLPRDVKLTTIKNFHSIANIPWQTITPNAMGDWLNQRNNKQYETFLSLGNKANKNTSPTIFNNYSCGVATSRDAWVYSFSKNAVKHNMQNLINFYNSELKRLQQLSSAEKKALNVDAFVNGDATKIKWSSSLKLYFKKEVSFHFQATHLITSQYRPFCKQFLYYGKDFNERPGHWKDIFPTPKHNNLAIGVIGKGKSVGFSTFIVNMIPNLDNIAGGQWFPLYTYQPTQSKANSNSQASLLNYDASHNPHATIQYAATQVLAPHATTASHSQAPMEDDSQYTRQDNISDATLISFQTIYGDTSITKEDIFYYIYGLLNSKQYVADYYEYITKEIPKIPMVEKFSVFAKAGRDLANLHLNYEDVPEYENLIIEKTFSKNTNATATQATTTTTSIHANATTTSTHANTSHHDASFYAVQKMVFAKKGKKEDKSTIIYNKYITIKGIPEIAYDYVVNGKSAIAWIMDRYQLKTDKDSKITNDPNLYSQDPQYILKLLLKVINVSVNSIDIVHNLPPIVLLNKKL